MHSSFADRYQLLQATIATAKSASPLAAPQVTLVGASKQQSPAMLAEALASGLLHFGENRVQEAAEKWPGLRESHPELGIQLRLIGPLQSNKARDAVKLFDVIETLDRPKLADALRDAMEKEQRRLPCLIQVNTGEEPQKSGVAPNELESLHRYATEQAGLEIIGLMGVPPADKAPAPHFAFLHARARELGLAQLSMGMSGDFETAIAFGATHIRVGTALFGAREA